MEPGSEMACLGDLEMDGEHTEEELETEAFDWCT